MDVKGKLAFTIKDRIPNASKYYMGLVMFITLVFNAFIFNTIIKNMNIQKLNYIEKE
jgi:hypothetical protein